MRQRNGSRIVRLIVVTACAHATLAGCAGLAPSADMSLITSFDDVTAMAPGTAAVKAAAADALTADTIDTSVVPPMAAPAASPLAAAIVRWRACVDRQLDESTNAALLGSAKGDLLALGALRERRSLEQRMASACEGHRRDVALHYPRHLERRVVASLTRQERRLGAAHESDPTAGQGDLVGALDSAFRALEPR